MSKQSTITASAAQEIAFANLYISQHNPRETANETGIEALAANIKAVGLIQNLGGIADAQGAKVAIVAGGRRLRALALLQDDAQFQTVMVNLAPDEATAKLWASSENSQREALHPADEIKDYGKMNTRGIAVPDIAVAYGVTEKHVYRRLALAEKQPGKGLNECQRN